MQLPYSLRRLVPQLLHDRAPPYHFLMWFKSQMLLNPTLSKLGSRPRIKIRFRLRVQNTQGCDQKLIVAVQFAVFDTAQNGKVPTRAKMTAMNVFANRESMAT